MRLQNDILDVTCPVEWGHPLNRGLVEEWSAVPKAAGWRGGPFRSMLRGAKFTHDGTLTGCTWGRSPDGLAAINVPSGSNYISTTFQIQTYAPADGSIIWWYNPSYSPTDGVVHEQWGQRQTSNGTPEISCQKYLDNNVYCGWNSAGHDNRIIFAASSSNWTQNIFQFFALTWVSGGTSTLYRCVKGKLGTVLGTASATTVTSPALNLVIGAADTASTTDADGYMRNFMVYNRCLSSNDVAALFEEDIAGNPNRWRWIKSKAYVFFSAAAPPARQQQLTLIGCGA